MHFSCRICIVALLYYSLKAWLARESNATSPTCVRIGKCYCQRDTYTNIQTFSCKEFLERDVYMTEQCLMRDVYMHGVSFEGCLQK